MNDKIQMTKQRAKIKEIFSSIQGEGIYLGVPQIFVRFDGCNTDCLYCDEKKKPAKFDLTVQELVKKIKALDKKSGPHHSVSLTGGEPLVHKEFLGSLLPRLKAAGYKIYLETNGTLPDNLKAVLKKIDIVAADIKLPSATKNKSFWQEHEESLKAAGPKAFVKVIATKDTKKEDIKKAVELVKKIDPKMPFVIQPSTGNGKFKAPDNKRLFEYKKLAAKSLKDVRIIPRVHKIIGVR